MDVHAAGMQLSRVPQAFVTRAILRAVRALPGYPELRVLDLSCGRGEIMRELSRDGCRVRGTHYRPDDYKLRDASAELLAGLAVDEDVDLLRPLPCAPASFDVVLLTEVVEHLPTYVPVIREVGRILAPGGHLMLSTSNLARLHSRLHFFLTGTHKLIRRRVGWDIAASGLYAYHIGPVDFPLPHTVLFQGGLRVQALAFTRFKARHAWLFTRIETKKGVPPGVRREGEEDLFRWMRHPAMLASEQLLVVARKEGPA